MRGPRNHVPRLPVRLIGSIAAFTLVAAGAATAGGVVGHGRGESASSLVCGTSDRTPQSDGRPFKGVRIRRGADRSLVPKGAVSLIVCSYNGMNATRATPQFALSGIGDTDRLRTLARITEELDAIHRATPDASYHCPNDDATKAILYFGYRSGPGDVVTVGLRGCNAVTNMAKQTARVPDPAPTPQYLALGAPVISQITALAKPVEGLKWATVVGHLRLCGGPAPGRCYIESYDSDDRVVVHALGDPWIAMAQIVHGRFRFRVAGSGTYTFGFYAGNTLVKQRRARVTAGRTTTVVFLIPIP